MAAMRIVPLFLALLLPALAACTHGQSADGAFAYGAEAYLVEEQPGIIEAHLRDPLPLAEASLIDEENQSVPAMEITRERVLYQSAGAPWPGFGFGIMGGSSGHVATGFGLGIPLFGGGGSETRAVNESIARFKIPDIDRYNASWQRWKIRLVLDDSDAGRVIEMLPPPPPGDGM